MKPLKLFLFIYFCFVTKAESQNGTNATLVWWPPDSSSLVLGVYFGAPRGGGGPGVASVDVFISLRLDILNNWGHAASLDALTTLLSQDVELEDDEEEDCAAQDDASASTSEHSAPTLSTGLTQWLQQGRECSDPSNRLHVWRPRLTRSETARLRNDMKILWNMLLMLQESLEKEKKHK